MTWGRWRGGVVRVAAVLMVLASQAMPQPTLAAYIPMPGDPLTGSGAVSRGVLPASELLTLTAPPAPVGNDAFALPANAAPASHQFQGTLVLSNTATRGSFTTLVDWYAYTSAFDSPWKHLPAMSPEFLQSGSYLIPTYEGLFVTGDPAWNYIMGTGRIWNEVGDGGRSRASVPFTLVERNQNCTHAGVLTFLFDGSAVSNVRYQITHETCLYFQFDMWGQLQAAYAPTSPANADAIRTNKSREVSSRLPVKPIADLIDDFPNTAANVSAFGGGVTPSAMSEYGLLIADPTSGGKLTNYVSGCGTRYGAYPFCAELRLPSYSTAKSTLAGIAFMHLAQQNVSVRNLKIGDYVPGWRVYAPAGAQWNNVTLNNTVDMATGHFLSSADVDLAGADENSPFERRYLNAEPDQARLAGALEYWPYQSAPGTTFVYHSHDTFLAMRAMQTYVGADLFNKIRDEVYAPLGMSAGFMTSLRTGNTSNNTAPVLGQALGSHGLFYTRDDIARLAKLLNNDAGVINGSQVLNASELSAAMQRNPADRGVSTPGGTVTNQRYNNAVWAKLMTRAEFPEAGYACDFWVPRMSGYGGIVVLMMPNGASYWYFSDNNEFSWYAAIQEANKLASMCG